MNTTKTVYNRLFSKKTELETHKIELGLVQDILKDTETLQKKYESIINKASKLSSDYDKVIKISKTVGVEMDSKFIEAGKFIKKIENL